MKKITYGFALSALLLAGCSQEESVMTHIQDEEVKMAFTVQAGAEAQTRATANYGIGANIDQLVCAVYERGEGEGEGENATYTFIKQEYGTQQTSGATDFKYEPVLLKGHTYKVVFWAMNKDAGYTLGTDGLTSITFPTTLSANNDALDVFTGHSKDVVAGTGEAQTVSLTRPFGQLNFATTEQDLTDVLALVKAGENATLTTSVEVTGQVATGYNALTQTFSYGTENTTTTFSAAAVPNVTYTTGQENKEEQVTYNWLSTNFLMTSGNVTCTIRLYVGEGENQEEANSLTVQQVPIKANTRTNVYGRLFTGTIAYNVSCTEDFAGEDENKDMDQPAE